MEDLMELAGREEILDTLGREVKKGRHILLYGPVGIGKSALLHALEAQAHDRGQKAIYVAQASPAKAMLIEIAQQLHERFRALPYRELVKNPDGDLSWNDIERPINRLPIRKLSHLLLDVFAAADAPYVLCLDAMERITPAQKAVIIAFLEKTQIIGSTTAKSSSGHLKSLWWSFKTYEIPPLNDAASGAIIESFIAEHGMLIEQPAMFRRHAIQAAGGNPKALHDILLNANKEKVIKKRYIREEVTHDAGVQYFDLTPLALLAGCLIMAWRFFARGMDTPDLYIFAGVGSAMFMFVRLFLYRGMAR